MAYAHALQVQPTNLLSRLKLIVRCAVYVLLAVLFRDWPASGYAVGMGYNGYIAPAARVRRLDWLWSLCYRQFRHAPPLIRPPNTKPQVQSRTRPFWVLVWYPTPWYPAIKLRSDEVRGVFAEAVP